MNESPLLMIEAALPASQRDFSLLAQTCSCSNLHKAEKGW
jgi:hypothetical protein